MIDSNGAHLRGVAARVSEPHLKVWYDRGRFRRYSRYSYACIPVASAPLAVCARVHECARVWRNFQSLREYEYAAAARRGKSYSLCELATIGARRAAHGA